MGKKSKTIALLLLIVLAGIFIKNLFSGPSKEPVDPKIYETKLKPINFPAKTFPEYEQNDNDIAIKIVRLWNLSEVNNRACESCLKTLADQHPNNIVQKNKWDSLYGINIGTNSWYELTSAFEKYATEVCHPFSLQEAENVYADSLKETLTENELSELLNFYRSDLGKKDITASLYATEKFEKIFGQKQREAISRESEIYNNKIEELQKRSK